MSAAKSTPILTEHTNPDGRVWVKIAQPSVWERRARLVLEEKLGRPIRLGYDAHHENEDVSDDSFENLEEEKHSEHTRIHSLARAAGATVALQLALGFGLGVR